MTAVDLLGSQVDYDQARIALKSWILSSPSPPEEVALDTAGTPENAFLNGLALAEEFRSEDRANYALAGFRSTAPIEWLRMHSLEFFGVPVQIAGYATTTETITNASGNLYGPFEPGELRFVNDATKAVYENTETITIQPAQLSPLVAWVGSVAIRAIEAGMVSNAAIGDIDRLETAKEGVTVTNAQAAQTVDDESAESINRRIDASIGLSGVAGVYNLSSGGPATAIESIALSGRDRGGGCLRADGSRVQVTRTKITRDDIAGAIDLYVGDDDGPLTVPDLAVVTSEVDWYAEWVSSTVRVNNVIMDTITVNASITIRKTTLTDLEIQNLVIAGFPAASLAVPVGGFALTPDNAVPIEYIEGAIRGPLAGKATIVTIAVTLPAADVIMTTPEVAQLTLGVLTITRIA